MSSQDHIPIEERITQKMPIIRMPKPTPPPVERPGQNLTTVDDAARQDGGKTTEDERVPLPELQKIRKNAADHSRDEPGS